MIALIALGLGVGGTTVALFILGLGCRNRYRPVGVCVWLAVLLPALRNLGVDPADYARKALDRLDRAGQSPKAGDLT